MSFGKRKLEDPYKKDPSKKVKNNRIGINTKENVEFLVWHNQISDVNVIGCCICISTIRTLLHFHGVGVFCSTCYTAYEKKKDQLPLVKFNNRRFDFSKLSSAEKIEMIKRNKTGIYYLSLIINRFNHEKGEKIFTRDILNLIKDYIFIEFNLEKKKREMKIGLKMKKKFGV